MLNLEQEPKEFFFVTGVSLVLWFVGGQEASSTPIDLAPSVPRTNIDPSFAKPKNVIYATVEKNH